MVMLFCISLHAQDSSASRVEDFLTLGIGAAFTDFSALDKLVYPSSKQLPAGFMLSSRFSFNFLVKERHYFGSNLLGAVAWGETPSNNYFEINQTAVDLHYGLVLRPQKRFQIWPEIGILTSAHQLYFEQNTGPNAKAGALLQSANNATRLSYGRIYGQASVAFTWKDKGEPSFPFSPNAYGLHLGFQQAIGEGWWRKSNQKTLSGPDLFDQIYTVHLSMQWFF